MAGRGRDELLQLGSTQGLQVTLEDTANKNRLESLKRGSTFQGTFSWIRPDGKENIIEYVGRPIKWQGKNHSIGIDRDITEKKLAENEREKMIKELIAAKEKAEKSDKLKTEFLAQISHEIRTPINSIIGCIDLIKDDNIKQLDQDLSDMLKSININGRRIIRTVDLILNASEMQIGTYQSTFTNINLGKKILNVIRSEYSALAEQKGLLFKFQNNLSSSVVYGDSYSIDQIFVNLIDNAVKYTESGKVDVLIDRDEENNIFVSVSDTGVGISEEYLPHIFEPFMQEERGYSRRYEGNGLGLSLVKKYCDLNGIKIKVESKKRIGSKFTITFTN
jgi:signal transduction histidine kinase